MYFPLRAIELDYGAVLHQHITAFKAFNVCKQAYSGSGHGCQTVRRSIASQLEMTGQEINNCLALLFTSSFL